MSEEAILQSLTDLKDSNGKEHTTIIKSVDCLDSTLKDHNGRLRRQEEWRNKMVGALIIISIIISGLIFPTIIKIIGGQSARADTVLSKEELSQIVEALKDK